jgi:hypothetical protein
MLNSYLKFQFSSSSQIMKKKNFFFSPFDVFSCSLFMFSCKIFLNRDHNNHINLASSIGSSISRVSSSSPSSTPTDSESQSHVGHVVLQTINNHSNLPTSISMQNNHVIHTISNSARSSEQEEEIAPPIASRPERTKSIVSVVILIIYLFFFKLIYCSFVLKVHTSN